MKVQPEDRIIITAGLPYPNGEPHLGHLASSYLPGDIFHRFCKSRGAKALYVCGTDDHGTPILIEAEKEGEKPEEYIKHWRKRWSEDLSDAGINFSIFHHTHSKENMKLAQHFFKTIKEKGYIYKEEIEQLYCENCERPLPDRYVKGTCPYCGAEDQYGDTCEQCGRTYEPTDLEDPRCAVCGSEPVSKKSDHYFFELSEFSDQLKRWLKENENLQEEVKNYVLSWIEEGLEDWDITRDIKLGVPIPSTEDKVFYGWWDNHLGYISFTLKLLREKGINGTDFWNSSKIYHFIGKGIVYHHFLFLPAMRMAEGTYKLPDYIPVRGYLNLEGKAFSKSRGWYISLKEFLDDFKADYLRFYLSLITPYKQRDVNFNWEGFQAKVNKELVDNLGNFIHRALTFLWSNYEGKVPEPNEYEKVDKEFKKKIKSIPNEVGELIEEMELDKGLKRILELSNSCNEYFQKKEPWKKGGKNCLYLSISAVKSLAILLEPYLPYSAENLWEQLDLAGNVHEQKWESASKLIEGGHRIQEPEPLFKKVPDEKIERKIEKLKSLKQGEGEEMERIDFEDFQELDLRIGQIKKVEDIEGADKLYKLKIDIGGETRTSAAGLKKYYTKDELKGKKVAVIANLEKAELMGVSSEVMVLAAVEDGVPVLLKPDKEVKVGSKIK